MEKLAAKFAKVLASLVLLIGYQYIKCHVIYQSDNKHKYSLLGIARNPRRLTALRCALLT